MATKRYRFGKLRVTVEDTDRRPPYTIYRVQVDAPGGASWWDTFWSPMAGALHASIAWDAISALHEARVRPEEYIAETVSDRLVGMKREKAVRSAEAFIAQANKFSVEELEEARVMGPARGPKEWAP